MLRALPFLLTLACSGEPTDGDPAASGGAGGTTSVPSACGELGADYPLHAGMKKAGKAGVLDFELVDVSPAPPAKFENTWTVGVSKASAAASGATLVVDTWMPEHGHASPKVVVVNDLGDGKYELRPVQLFMSGVWEITVTATTAADDTDGVTFQFCLP